MQVNVISLFPQMFELLSTQGVTGRAHEQGIWSLSTWNPRHYTHDIHKTVDDRPYGGGPGMVMLAQPLLDALNDIKQHQQSSGPVILLSPAGVPFNQAQAERLSQLPHMTFVCGRYEGIDQRFIEHYVDEEISLGDFVLSGGEIAALAVLDATIRLLPGVLNDQQSALQDSFHPQLSGLLDCEHYTRPEVFEGLAVPPVLLSGHHANIQQWRRQRSLQLTAERRPDLLQQARDKGLLSKADLKFLAQLASDNLS
ncbi:MULTISPECIES: tRNA (guanosine(37)-N1)-methyltransferase TrmD [Oligella]|uniref:tRNA (guanosine(37)-N1)-methyltransferase TrmD n=1 Tax=Oligella TaxID=90243 RepID=UPI0008A467EB|nr:MULTISPECIES: tRNA (guanosine(37)-N1)-methyltransferase TrmD [Oligella]AVL71462.1 tRNA (guanosine(37)-N1)-methyltransferase TrmD [Oligella urethralis]OFV48487.1 tRNA (guanine(37)-N(1))-methyltransferase [Oligella sp. HMSC09E12]SUA54308.1 tRNA (guanine-N(1)-)-methyltransferase [Oligella urethralis]